MNALTRIGLARLIPVIRARTSDGAEQDAERLVAAGLDVVELTTTTPDWPRILARLCSVHPELCVGVGTMRDAADARAALDHGAQFLVSPGLRPEVRAVAQGADALSIEGGFTPTELLTALDSGGPAKLFPAHVGGIEYLRSFLAVRPDALIIPSGGIRVDDVADWLSAGAYAVGVGRELLDSPDLPARVAALRQDRNE